MRWLLLLALIARAGSFDSPVFLSHTTTPGTGSCVDSDPKCAIWASQNECTTNAAWMMGNCRRSCQSCQGGENAWRLRTQLASTYDQSSGGAKNYSVNRVTIQSIRVDHIEVKESSQIVSTSGQIVLTWNDSRVAWDKNEWNIAWLNFYWIPFWTPHIILQNALPGSAGTLSWRELAANYTGQVYMWLDFTFEAACEFEYSNFPNDNQVCCYKMDERRYYTVKFYVADGARADASDSISKASSGGWRLKSVDLRENAYSVKILSDWHKNPFNIINQNAQMCVTIQRLGSYHAAEIAGPAIAASVVTLTSFLVSGFSYQVLMLIGSLILQLLSLYPLNTKLPPSYSGTPNVVKFYSINMAFTLIILVLFVLLEKFAKFKGGIPAPRILEKAIDLFAKICPCLRAEVHDKEIIEMKTESGLQTTSSFGDYQWARTALALKYLLFSVFLSLYVFSMLGCLSV